MHRWRQRGRAHARALRSKALAGHFAGGGPARARALRDRTALRFTVRQWPCARTGAAPKVKPKPKPTAAMTTGTTAAAQAVAAPGTQVVGCQPGCGPESI